MVYFVGYGTMLLSSMSTLFYVRYKLKLYIPFKYIIIVCEPQIFVYVPFKNTKLEDTFIAFKIGRQNFEKIDGHNAAIEVTRFRLFSFNVMLCYGVKISLLQDAWRLQIRSKKYVQEIYSDRFVNTKFCSMDRRWKPRFFPAALQSI